jgi:lipopolysaccharide transport system ATP-binding protein
VWDNQSLLNEQFPWFMPEADQPSPPDADVAIAAHNLSKRFQVYAKPIDRVKQALFGREADNTYYDAIWALKSLNFEVKRGETFGIIGSNGSGKSTLLSILCSTIAPTGGRFSVHGKVAALLELGAGFDPLFTGRENVYLNGTLWGLSREQIDARFEQIAAFADIGEFIDRPVKTYSSGMTVRLAFAIAAHVDAQILIIDEALAVGDALFTQKCMRYLRKFKESGTLLFVSHELGSVINLCDRALWIEKGEQRMLGDSRSVCEAYIAHLFKSQQPQAASAEQQSPAARSDTSEQNFDLPPSRSDHDYESGQARITSVSVIDKSGKVLQTATGGDLLTLVVKAQTSQPMFSPLIGFFLKDALGQNLFGDNTSESTLGRPMNLQAGEQFTTRFTFELPTLVAGDYTFCVAFAEGSRNEFLQHHWVHDALVLKVHGVASHRGLVGIPVQVEMNLK